MIKKFSIPYNNDNPNRYLQMIDKYYEFIDSIFLGLQELGNFNNPYAIYKFYDPRKKEIKNNSYELLEKTKGKYKRIITCNNVVEPSIYNTDSDIIYFKKKIYPLIEKYEIDGFILTNYILLKELHKDFPWLSLQSSCNCMMYDIKTMDYWRKAGCTVFNPPRNTSLDLSLLQKMHSEGFILKLLVNENCIYGCPKMMNHNTDPFHMTYHIDEVCFVNDISDIFKTNLIMPEWLSEYDEFIDIYKLKGRVNSTSFLDKVINAYVSRKNSMYLNDFITGGLINYCNQHHILIPSILKPKKLLQCQCMHCDTCNYCSIVANKLVKDSKDIV